MFHALTRDLRRDYRIQAVALSFSKVAGDLVDQARGTQYRREESRYAYF